MNLKRNLQINWGGKIPKDLYTLHDETNEDKLNFKEITVRKGARIKIELDCKADESLLQ